MYLLYVPSLYVHERRHTIAPQAKQDGQDKRLRPSAQLELAYRVRTPRHRANFSTTAIVPRSPFDRTPPRHSTRSHIHRRRWRRRLAAQRRARSCSSRSLDARDPPGRRDHARWPLGAHAPRAGASGRPGAADGRGQGALKRRPGSFLAPGYRRWRANRGDIGQAVIFTFTLGFCDTAPP